MTYTSQKRKCLKSNQCDGNITSLWFFFSFFFGRCCRRLLPGCLRTRRWWGWPRCWTWPGWRAPRSPWAWPVQIHRRWPSARWRRRASSTACSRTPWRAPSTGCAAPCAGPPAGWSYPPGGVKEEAVSLGQDGGQICVTSSSRGLNVTKVSYWEKMFPKFLWDAFM